MNGRYDVFVQRLTQGILDTPGATAPALRRAVLERGKQPLPPALATYINKVDRHAYKVTDDDMKALRANHSEDELFELTVAAAVGAALHRLERGMAALRGEEPD